MFKKNEENQSIEGSDAELMFSNRFLVKLLWPLFVEQFLIFAVGLVDSVMVASVGEAAVSAVETFGNTVVSAEPVAYLFYKTFQ
mgnify:CR=1 FL=1